MLKMNKCLQGSLFLLLFVAMSCHVGKYDKISDGIIVHLKAKTGSITQSIRLQIVNEDVIHVSASPNRSFSDVKSLMVEENKHSTVKWDIEEKGDTAILRTSKLNVKISILTGEVFFTNKKGLPILSENHGGGKTFIPYTADGQSFYHIRQVFESPDDEAFYGLGENQDGILNFKGKDNNLTQRNTVAVVPFVVSSRNYGILWDNNSITKFGDFRDYHPLSGLKLYSAEGVPGGLTAIYESRSVPGKVFVNRTDSVIDYEFIKSLKSLPDGFPMADGKVQWSGFVGSDYTGVHKFLLFSSGYIKLWLDGKLVVDKWRQSWNPTTTRLILDMEKGKKYAMKLEWVPDGNESFTSLKFLTPYPQEEQNKLSLYSETAKQLDYYFVYGENLDQVISGYRQLTGKTPIMPKWAMGFWQSRQRYTTQEEILSTVREFRERKVPLDNIVLDWHYWKEDQWGSHEFEASRFPNPEGMIKDLHDKYNTQLMISVWPKFYVGTENYKLFNDKGWLYKRNVENNQKDWVCCVSTFYDAFNPQARQLFWSLMNKKLFSKGIDAWWLDATEPEILSNISIEDRKSLMGPTALGPSSEYFNAFPLMNAKGVYEGQREEKPNQRVFILTRSAFAGIQRYASATWSGDIASRWQDMKNQIAAGLSFSISGVPYWTMDIGGFSVEKRFENAKGNDLDEWRELQTRWYQFGAFCPLFRAHGEFPHREIFNIAPGSHPAYQSILYYDQLRYRLMPYIYSLACKTYHEDFTIMRPLVMDFETDTSVLDIKDEFMFGKEILVSPVCEYRAKSRPVYLPSGTEWYDLYTGKEMRGGQVITAEAPYTRIPVFVKAGSIIPYGPEIQYTTEKKADPLTLFVYTGKNGEFTLYEDENINYNYEKGSFSSISFSYDESLKTLVIGQRKGSFNGMLPDRFIHIIWIAKDKPVGLHFNLTPDTEVKYTGKGVSVKMK
jgi:alpha-D-xyloside xylohydrolase